MSQFEREEEDIQKRFACGEITREQMWIELREVKRDYRGAAEESAREAYERELDNW